LGKAQRRKKRECACNGDGLYDLLKHGGKKEEYGKSKVRSRKVKTGGGRKFRETDVGEICKETRSRIGPEEIKKTLRRSNLAVLGEKSRETRVRQRGIPFVWGSSLVLDFRKIERVNKVGGGRTVPFYP